MKQRKRNLSKQRQAFLLSFFPNSDLTYEVLPINGFVLVKHIVNGDPTHFEVAIYTKESYSRAEEYKQHYSHMQSIRRETRSG